MTHPPVLSSIVDWLKAGYPDGIPDHDYAPLLALLARRLTNDEVAAVAHELSADPAVQADGMVENSDIRALIGRITNEPPRREDVERVRAHLSSAGPFL